MILRIRSVLWLAFAIFVVNTTHSAVETNNATMRPANWATQLTEPGLSNFYEVTTNLYRGAQPTAQGMKELKAMGIKTVLNLRSFHSDNHLISSGELKLARLHMKPWHAEDEDVVAFLKLVMDTNNLPVFVHCQRGADRTGMICAMYRVVVCGWTKDDAVKEMKKGGFHFNPGWQNLVNYVEHADVGGLKKRAGIASK
ncbi:MAG TPA: tyrosine-protein phosphatase [Candidatus Polarisedimenticolia bacterium]|nr:tyrosine-protein phosphatase [Candidatus Polarisedimenticolia bacterium]